MLLKVARQVMTMSMMSAAMRQVREVTATETVAVHVSSVSGMYDAYGRRVITHI